jgi:hypothetical protein
MMQQKKKQRRRSIKYSRNRITKEIAGGGFTVFDADAYLALEQQNLAAAAEQQELIDRAARARRGQPSCLIM